jgi:hypothetical protein
MRLSRLAPAFALLLAVAVPAAQAQRADAPIASDRPGFATGAATMAPGTVQAELGYDYTAQDFSNPVLDEAVDGSKSVHSLGQLLLRYGVTDAVEVRANVGSYGFSEEPSGVTIQPGDVSPSTDLDGGYNGAALEAKARLFRGPTATVSAFSATSVPLGSGPFEASDERARQTVLALLDGALGQNLTLTINAGPSFYWSAGEQDDRFFTALFIPTLSFSINERTGGYVGYAGEYTETANANFVETGFTYLVNTDTQVDVNGGLRVDDNQDAFFLGLGLSHRF